MKHGNMLLRKGVESPSLEISKRNTGMGVGTWFSGGQGGADLMLGLDDFKTSSNSNSARVTVFLLVLGDIENEL